MEETMKCKENECKCGKNRWQTVKKGLQFKCRHCGNIVSATRETTTNPETSTPEIKET